MYGIKLKLWSALSKLAPFPGPPFLFFVGARGEPGKEANLNHDVGDSFTRRNEPHPHNNYRVVHYLELHSVAVGIVG